MANGDRKFRVCHLTSVHTHNDIRIFLKECCSAASAGFETHLIAPGAEDKIVSGVHLHGVAESGSNRFLRITRTAWEVYRKACCIDADLYHFHDPELIPAGLLLSLRGKRVIYDVHEDYPSSLSHKDREWVHPFLRSVLPQGVAFLEWFGTIFFSGIITATPAIAERFPALKTTVVQNFPIINELQPVDPIPYEKRDNVVVYVGGISELRGAETMVESAGLLPENLKAHLLLAGAFSPAGLEDELKQLPGWRRVRFLGWQSRKNVADILGKARLGLVLFHPAPNHINSQPNKLFEYMSAGIPVVASDFPLWRDLIGKAGCGLLVDPLQPAAIAEAIQWLLEHPCEAESMGQRGQTAVSKIFNWNRESKKLLNFYKGILI